MSYNLFLDDIREPKCLGGVLAWEVVRNYHEFKTMILNRGVPRLISFDHDLADEQYEHVGEDIIYVDPLWKDRTGYHCARWLIEWCQNRGLPLPEFQVHSMNPVGRQNITQLLQTAKEREHTWIKSKPEASEKP